MSTRPLHRIRSALRGFLASEAAGGIVLIACAALALALANSPWHAAYHGAFEVPLAGLSLHAWINDALMALFFLLVGLEIKHEVLHGQLRQWGDRALPGLAALGGMAGPAALFAAINLGHPATLRGWAIPTATDIAFALGVMALLGRRVPASLKLFLTTLAVIDDLGAVLIIALFYSQGLAPWALAGAAACLAALAALNRAGVRRLWPYLALGVPLWLCVLASGVHATVAGVLLALAVPADRRPAEAHGAEPLHRLEGALAPVVGFGILPLFAFANAGVDLGALESGGIWTPLTLGVAAGLFAGKQAGVMGATALTVTAGLARRPAGATWMQVYGTALLCGIGFTMSLFIGLLAFPDDAVLQAETKAGVLLGSLASALFGAAVLAFAGRRVSGPRVPPARP